MDQGVSFVVMIKSINLWQHPAQNVRVRPMGCTQMRLEDGATAIVIWSTTNA